MKNLISILLLLLVVCATSNALAAEEVVTPVQESKTTSREAIQDRANSSQVEELNAAYGEFLLAEAINKKCGYQDGNDVEVLASGRRYLKLMIIKHIGPDLTREQLIEVYLETYESDSESERLRAESAAETLTCGPDGLEFFNYTSNLAEQLIKLWDATLGE